VGVPETRVANAEQSKLWNGKLGRFWRVHSERHLIAHQHLIPHLFIAARISPGQRVLDVGCGCGATTVRAAYAARELPGAWRDARPPNEDDRGLRGGVIGLDVSGPLLAEARHLAAQADTASIGFIRGDAQSCPLRPDSCDVAISSFGVMFFDNPVKAFANIAVAVRRHGRLAFLSWQDDTQNEFTSIPLREFARHISLPTPAGDDLFYHPRQIRQLLSGTGWEEIEINRIEEPVWMGSDVADVMNYVRGIPAIMHLAARLDDSLAFLTPAEHACRVEQVWKAIEDQYALRQRRDGVWVHGAAWLVTAHRA
jgi:ubiquinone/menaquinone biosynthesis C-methylase UbiE